jgi:hypothetical protein
VEEKFEIKVLICQCLPQDVNRSPERPSCAVSAKGHFRVILERGRHGAPLSVTAVFSLSRSSCSMLESEDLKSSSVFNSFIGEFVIKVV